ncbi:stabilizer of axonemal microtubules 4 [Odontesthes bonariensis]|uniref:stabilizer of axonemal microtubules 4 n=1 Tax=Odontesthes bonariensis TaxID=219752 RepID=UPI003F58691D
MAEQGRIVMPTVGAAGRKGRLSSSNKLKLSNNSYTVMRFTSYVGRPSVTGFTSNQRPAIYYKPSLDLIDNPQFGSLLSDSFLSQTKRHYQPHLSFNYLGSLPNLTNKPTDSGFHQLRSHLKTLAVEEKTEYQQLFVPHRLTASVPENHVRMGPKGKTGFTEGTELQLNTFQEKNSHTVVPRQTQRSVMKSDFVPPSPLQGTEAIVGLCTHSCRETGFTRGAIAPLACPTSLLPLPQTKSSAPTVKTIGKKELTGALLNVPSNQAFPNTSFDSSHFATHYNTK